MDVSMNSDQSDFMASYVLRVARTVAEHGYAVHPVLADGRSAPYSYTIGLHQSHGYELVMTGLSPEVTSGVLHALVDRFADSAGPDPDALLDGVLSGGFQVRMRRVDSLVHFSLLQAVFGDDARPPYWQVVWPDRFGVFADDAACSLSPGVQPFF